MKIRKLFAILLAASLLTACGNETTPQESAPIVSQQDSTAEETESHTPKEDVIVTMAVCGEPIPQLAKAIKTFNGLGRGYRIELKDYSPYVELINGQRYPESDFPMTAKMQIDIVNGTDIDIVHEASFMDCGKFDMLCHKGAFADLYSFMENDDEINKETLNSHVLELHEINGALYSLPMAFQVETLIGDARYVGTKEDWTMDELIEKWEKAPDNVTFNGTMDKWYVYDDFLKGNIGQFVDYENATVSFDSPDFLRILKFCNSFPESEMYFSDAYAGMDRFVESCTIRGFQNFHNQLWSMDGKDYTFVGYPSYDGNGAFINTSGFRYAICYKSPPEEQQGA